MPISMLRPQLSFMLQFYSIVMYYIVIISENAVLIVATPVERVK